MAKILVIDDDNDMCNLMNRFLTKNGYEVMTASTGKKGLDALETFNPDLVLSDYRLEDMTGSELLLKIKSYRFHLPVIIITGYSDIKIAVELMKNGAVDYIAKPLYPDEILLTIKNHIERKRTDNVQQASQQPMVHYRKEENGMHKTTTGEFIHGDSAVFKSILQQVSRVAPTNYSVIIYGESGSGKEVIAKEIHLLSKRSDKPFVAVDCGALTRELAGSELFGHEKGSFTGAVNQKIGIFEMGNGGTVFLDEIGNLSYDIQIALLRVVQERKMRRVGGTKDIELDVRIIVASNEKLWDYARKGKFREDLFHRFNEFSINVPPLRERSEDIHLFASYFLEHANKELGKQIKGFSPQVANIFLNYVWYGNLRELKNVIKRAALLTDSDYVEVSSLPFEITHFNKLQFDNNNAGAESMSLPIDGTPAPVVHKEEPVIVHPVPETMTQYKKAIDHHSLKEASLDAEYGTILEALKKVNFNKSKAARLLNIDRKTLYNKMKQFQEFNNQ